MHARVEVGGGEHGPHARQSQGRGCVDAAYPGARERAAYEARVEHAGADDVVDERATARQQPRVLHALDASSDVPGRAELGGGHRRAPLGGRKLERLF